MSCGPITSPFTSLFLQMIGQLNYDVWRGIIGFLVDDMRIKRDFPNKPVVSTSVPHIHMHAGL